MRVNLPTKKKLESLRRRGSGPLSLLATRAWILAATFGVILFFAERVHKELTASVGGWSSLLSEPGRVLKPFLILAATLSGVALLVGVLITMLQTRAASGFVMVDSTPRSTEKRVAFSLLIQIILATGVALFVASLLLPQALLAFRLGERGSIDVHFSALADKVCKLVVVVAVVLAILVMFVSRAVTLFRTQKE